MREGRHIMRKVVSILFFLGLTTRSLFSLGVGMEPVIIDIGGITPGTSYNLEADAGISINLLGDKASVLGYELKISSPKSVFKGFLPLPDPEWIKLPRDTITVMPQDTGKLNMVISIPDSEGYYNQAWMFKVTAKAYPGGFGKETALKGTGMGIRLAVSSYYIIETAPKPEPELPPDGVIAVAPSKLYTTCKLGGEVEKEITIFNNDTIPREFTLVSFIPPPADTLSYNFRIEPSEPRNFYPEDASWVVPKKRRFLLIFKKPPKIILAPGESVSYPVKIHLPDDKELLSNNWEVLLFLVPKGEARLRRFVRVVITPEE